MKLRSKLFFIIGLLIITSLACSQAGEIISPEDATERAQTVSSGDSGSIGGTSSLGIVTGDEVTLIGRGFLINLLDQPDGRISGGQARDSQVIITDIATLEDETWYKIDANGTEGWVKEENLSIPEGGAGADATFEGPQVNDQIYLAGTGFLINFLGEPDGNIVTADRKGTTAIITEIRDVDGVLWYQLDSAAGSGWVAAENISVDEP